MAVRRPMPNPRNLTFRSQFTRSRECVEFSGLVRKLRTLRTPIQGGTETVVDVEGEGGVHEGSSGTKDSTMIILDMENIPMKITSEHR